MNHKFRQVIEKFYLDLECIQGLDLIDIVLYGSAVNGDFIEGKGDLDFIVFLGNELSTEQVDEIFLLHENYRVKDDLLSQLEGAYYTINNEYLIKSGLYIGTSRKGWKRIDNLIHGSIEQGMILSNYSRLNGKIDLDKLFMLDKLGIRDEINKINKEIVSLSKKLNDTAFNVYGIQTLARCLYTKHTEAFTSKSHAIDYLYEFGFNESKDVLSIIKKMRYPYSKDELEALSFEKTSKVLLEVANQLNM